LNSDAPSAEDWQLGDPFMLHYDYVLKSQTEVMQLFGSEFADDIFQMSQGNWQGPVRSGYGMHLVFIREMIAPREPSIDEVRDRVNNDLVTQRRTDSFETFYKSLRDKYDIQVTTSKVKERI
jgi:hypothetical protein